MNLCLFEDDQVYHLQPLVHTRAVYDLRLGMRTLLETTRDAFENPRILLHARRQVAGLTAQELDLLTNRIPDGLDVLFVNGRFIAEDGPVLERLWRAARDGEQGRVFVQGSNVVAAWVPNASNRLVASNTLDRATFGDLPEESLEGAALISRLWHLIDEIAPSLLRDFTVRTRGYNIYERPGAHIHESAVLAEEERIYIGRGATVRPGAVLNAEQGAIYIDEHATVMEHAVVRGPAYIGPHAQVMVGGYVDTAAIGPWSKAGGEVRHSIIHSYSNKAHSGFLGHSYLGRWCNLGAGTVTSNLKNDYGTVTLYNEHLAEFEETGRQFIGTFMGDHSKCGINTTINTGTVIGVFCNIYGHGFPPRYIPSFSWGSPEAGFSEYRLDKALDVAEAVMLRRNTSLSDAERDLLAAIAETEKSRMSRRTTD